MSSIPSIDLSPFFVDEGVIIGKEATPDQKECAKAIDEACRLHGFLHVTGFGVDQDLHRNAFAASEELFESPLLGESCRRWEPSHNMGYSPLKTESVNPSRPPELKEAFNVRFPPTHQNDFRGCAASFTNVSLELLRVFRKTASRYAIACALALNLPTDFFDETLKEMDLCTIRFLHYPPCDFDETSISIDKPIRVGEHTDFGAFTFLLLGAHGAEGLQIKPVEGGAVGGEAGGEYEGWLDVEVPSTPQQQGAIVNTGALMARWTNDEWRATAHRVIVPSKTQASRHRYSIALFVDPDATALVTVHNRFITDDNPSRYEPITGKAFLEQKLSEMGKPKRNVTAASPS